MDALFRLALPVKRFYLGYMLAIQLDPETEMRLERLAKLTGRTETSYAQEAITEFLDDLEDIEVATERSKTPGRTFSADEVKRELNHQ